jgi:DNA-binding response OmpR family regulator
MIMPDRPVVMVVEDDQEMNELERELLQAYGMDSVPAYTGAEALEVFRRCRPGAVLLDVMLPEMDGFETCRRLRAVEAGVPIVMLTALDGDESRRRGFEVGANAYFCKPFDPDEVARKLTDLLTE